MVYATLELTSPYTYKMRAHTRTHLPIEKAPKIITLIWFSGSNLILSFTSHFYFLSIFPPHLHRRRRRRWHDGACCFSIHIHIFSIYIMLSLPGLLLCGCLLLANNRESRQRRGRVGWWESYTIHIHRVPEQAHTKIISLKQHRFLEMVGYAHIHIIKIKSIVESMMGIEREKSASANAKGNSKRDTQCVCVREAIRGKNRTHNMQIVDVQKPNRFIPIHWRCHRKYTHTYIHAQTKSTRRHRQSAHATPFSLSHSFSLYRIYSHTSYSYEINYKKSKIKKIK